MYPSGHHIGGVAMGPKSRENRMTFTVSNLTRQAIELMAEARDMNITEAMNQLVARGLTIEAEIARGHEVISRDSEGHERLIADSNGEYTAFRPLLNGQKNG